MSSTSDAVAVEGVINIRAQIAPSLGANLKENRAQSKYSAMTLNLSNLLFTMRLLCSIILIQIGL